MTRERFTEYIRRFNNRDERYADFYADEVTFEHGQLIVSLQNTIDVVADHPDFPPRALKKGEHYTRSGTITYDLHAGRFVRISDGNH
jgi:hypothetical protein